MKMMQRAGALVLFGAVGAGAYFLLSPRFPKDQSVNVVLGDRAPSVTELTMRYSSDKDADLRRDVRFHFDKGKAPRVMHHEARLPDGDYVVSIEMRGDEVWTKERRVHLEGGSTTQIEGFSLSAGEAGR
jgi:hypothetical protein